MSAQSLSTVPAAQRVIATNEKVTGPPAVELIRQSGILGDASGEVKVLDNATGGGILVSELLKHYENMQNLNVIAGDVNEQMLAYTQQRRQDELWDRRGSRIEISNINQESPGLPINSLNYVFNNFGVFFSKDDTCTLSQTYKLLKPNGKALFTSWKRIAWWTSLVLPAMQRHLPDAPRLPDPMTMFLDAWNNPDTTESKMKAAGFRNVSTEMYSFSPDVEGVEFAEACATLVGAVAKRAWTEDEFTKFASKIEGALRQYLMNTFPGGKWNGSMFAVITMGEK